MKTEGARIVEARPQTIVLRGGSKGGGGGGASEADDTLHSKQIARFIEIISEGPIQGPVTPEEPFQSAWFNNTLVMNAEGQMNFLGLAIAMRAGYPNQAPIGGFSAAETEVAVDTQVTVAEPLVRAVTDSNNTSLRVTIELPALYAQDPTNGDITTTPIHVQVWLQENGGIYNLVVDDDMGSQKTISPYDKAYRIALPQPVTTRNSDGTVTVTGGAPWNVKVVRITPDSITTNLQNVTVWKSYTEIIDGSFAYPDCALLALAVDAQQFGTQIPTRRYEVFGRLVQVPSNYDPTTRTYNTDGQPWDGSFKVAYSNNPAWCYMDMVLHPRYGLGDRMTVDQVDIGSLYTIAQWCDELVDDGFGGKEPRYTFNAWIYERKDALKLLADMVSVFKGIVFWGNGELMTRADMPGTPKKLVAPANVLDGYFSYSGTALSARHTAALTSFDDPNDSYLPSIDVFEDLETIVSLGYRTLETTAFGVTSQGQAHRSGKWAILTEKLQTDVVTYTAAFDHLWNLGPYDLVQVADPSYAGTRLGGRIVSATANSLTIDAPITLDPGATSTVDMQMPDDSIQVRQLTNAAGEGITVLTWDEPLDQVDGAVVLPNPHAMWMVATSDQEPRQFRILSMQEVDGKPNQVQVVALFHEPQKYGIIEQDIAFQPVTYARFNDSTIDPPTNLNFAEGQYQVNGFWYNRLVVSWTLSDEPLVSEYLVTYTAPDGTTTNMPSTIQNTVTLNTLQEGAYGFNVVARVGSTGRQSAPLLGTFTVNGKTWPPGAPTGLVASGQFDEIVLKWVGSPDSDIQTYEVFALTISVDATVPGNLPTIVAGKIGESGSATTFTHSGLTAGQFFYYHVRARDFVGNPSDMSNEAYAITSYLVPIEALGEAAVGQSLLVPALQEQIATWPNLVSSIIQAAGHVTTALASVTVETTARQEADKSLAEQIVTVQASFGDGIALVRQDLQSEVDARQALASSVTDLQVYFEGNFAAVQDSFQVLATASDVTAQHIVSLTTQSVNTQATVQETQQSINGITAEWTMKTELDVNGIPYVAGMGLVTTLSDKGVPTSEMTIISQKFMICHLNDDGSISKGTPFFIGPDPTYTGGGTAPTVILLGGDGSTVYAGKITLNQLISQGVMTSALVVRPDGAGGGFQFYNASGVLVLGNDGLSDNVVGTGTLQLNAATEPLFQEVGTAFYGSSGAPYQLVAHFTPNLVDTASVLVIVNWMMDYNEGDNKNDAIRWSAKIVIDGTTVIERPSRRFITSTMLSYATALAAGPHTIDFYWGGSNSSDSTVQAELFTIAIWGSYR